MNTTDLISGARVGFTQEAFNVICSALAPFKAARAAAASSAVPLVLSPVTLRNYAGSCGFRMPEYLQKFLEDPGPAAQRFRIEDDVRPYLDAEKTPYLPLVDGGVSDNLGLRAYLSRALALGGFLKAFGPFGAERARRVVFIVLNAARECQEFTAEGNGPLVVDDAHRALLRGDVACER